jgi:hypothetical protein
MLFGQMAWHLFGKTTQETLCNRRVMLNKHLKFCQGIKFMQFEKTS